MEVNLLLLFGIGFVSLVSGWQGLSVGFLAMPVLLIFLPDLFSQVQLYALVLSAVTALAFLVLTRRELKLDLKQAIILGGNAVLAASLAALMFYSLIDHGCMIMFFFGYSFLLCYGAYTFSSESVSNRPSRFLMVFSATIVTSILSGLLGVGTGYILLPFLVFSGMELKRSVATSAFVELFASIFALLPRLPVAHWDILLTGGMIGLSILGTCIGIYLSGSYPLKRKAKIVLFIGLSGLVLYAARQVIRVCPTFSGSEHFTTQAALRVEATPLRSEAGVVHSILFSTSECHDCQLIAAEVLRLSSEGNYGRFAVETVDIVTSADVDYLYQAAAVFGLTQEEVDLPLLIIGEQVLVNAEISERLPELLETFLEAGGAERPKIPARTDMSEIRTAAPQQTPPPIEMRNNGFMLAIAITIGMVGALVYSGVAFVRGVNDIAPGPKLSWRDIATPVLALVGLGVAAYLAYVETQAVETVCGPVGDCNAVQTSPYAYLFGVLPIGVLGVIGYLAILAVWLYARLRSDRFARMTPLLIFGMAFFGVLFSLYLTYLEPFVIRAVCIWCLTSAVIMTLLLLVSLKPGILALDSKWTSDDEEKAP